MPQYLHWLIIANTKLIYDCMHMLLKVRFELSTLQILLYFLGIYNQQDIVDTDKALHRNYKAINDILP